MQPRAGHFAHSVQARQRRNTIDIGPHTPALIMSRRHHWNRMLRDVHAKFEALAIDVRKSINDERGWFMRDIQEHMIGSRPLHFTVNRSRNDIARSQTCQRMRIRHELASVQIPQHGPFSAQRLTHQK